MVGKTEKLLSLLNGQPVIPVLKIDRAVDAVPLARALAAGGLRVIEITLRTDEALECIRRVAAEVPEAIVGAGTILNPEQFDEAAKAGSQFIVSPGLTPDLIKAAAASPVPLLPGCITPGEIMAARDAGLDFLKFFPGRTGRRRAVPEGARLANRRCDLLPDRQRDRQVGAGLSGAAERRLRRRLLGCAGCHGQRRPLGRDRGAGARGEQAAQGLERQIKLPPANNENGR